MNKKKRTVQSVDRTIRLLELLAENEDGMSLQKLSIKTGLAPQTVQSLLRTLQAHHWVAQTERGSPYMLGPAVVRLAGQWQEGGKLATLAREAVAALARRTREYVLLAELHGTTLTALVEERVERSLMLGRIREYGPERLHNMATGQVLLAALETRTRERMVNSLPLRHGGPQAYTDHRDFLAYLEQVAEQGYSLCRNQADNHIAAMAVPVRDTIGRTRAALGISIPEVRFAAGRETSLLAELRGCAAEIEAKWGGACRS